MGELNIDLELIQIISHQMDLRAPNAEAVQDIAVAISDHYDRREATGTFEGVVASATGVGKTFVIGATIDYLAQARDWTNFVIVVPGRTILQKTIDNFTPGAGRDISKLLGVRTVLVTAENFDSPEIARQLEDRNVVKVFVFTVQALLRPTDALRRRTRSFSEGLGAELYQWLVDADDLTVLADEHHLYYGEQFSDTLRGLSPKAIIGLTATPHRDTETDQIIYRYPLSAAIADKWVKTPVIVGRKDDRSDLLTRLNDGAALLEVKRAAMDAYVASNGIENTTNPFMLIVASNTTEADEIVALLRSEEFRAGAYASAVLQVDSTVTEEKEPQMWSRLSEVDSPSSEVRIVVSVRMLKEGWDVRSVYVLLSTQPSISNILTEQVLGRGLRLPLGRYTNVEMLDTLEVVAHERFSQLLDRAGVLNESLISFRTRTVIVANQNGQQSVMTTQIADGGAPVRVADGETGSETPGLQEWEASELDSPGVLAISTIDTRTEWGASETRELGRPAVELAEGFVEIHLPKLHQVPVTGPRTLAALTDENSLENLGRRLQAQPEDELRRMRITAIRVTGPDGIVRSETRQESASDLISSAPALDVDLEWSRAELVRHIMQLPMVDASAAARLVEKTNATRLVDAFIRGLGNDAESLLAAYLGRSAARLGKHVQDELRRVSPAVTYTEDFEDVIFQPSRRLGTREESTDLRGRFSTSLAYTGWLKSPLSHSWFDSLPERKVALVLDEEDDIEWWVRLNIGDLAIAWGSGQMYNPDLLAAGKSGERWLIEVKADDHMNDDDVQAKRQSARSWVNYVNGLPEVQARGERWKYLLISESDIEQAHDSWAALAAFG